MSLFPMSNAASLVRPKPIEQLVQGALRTTTRDPKSVSTAVAKLLPDKLKAFANETRGLPRVSLPPEPTAAVGGTDFDGRRIDQLVDGLRSRFDDLIGEVDAEQSGPVIEAIRRTVLDAIEQGRAAAPKALAATSRDMLFAIRTILRERALELRVHGLGAASLRRHYFDLADDIDQVSALLLVLGGAAVQQADAGTGETLLDIGVNELRARAEQVLRALDRLSGLEEHAYDPDDTYWPAHYNALRDWLSLRAGGDKFRPQLVRDELGRFMFRLVDLAGESSDASFREARAGIAAGRVFLDEFIVELNQFLASAARPALAPNDPDRFAQFIDALQNFANGFMGTAGLLVGLAARPLALQSWSALRAPFGPQPPQLQALALLIPWLLMQRARFGQLQWLYMDNAAPLQTIVVFLYVLDRDIDRSLRGVVYV